MATRDSTLGSKLAELAKLRESIAANRPQLVNALGAAADQLTKLPAGKRRLAILGSAITIVWVLFIAWGFILRVPGFFVSGKSESKTTKSANPITRPSTVSPASAGNNQNSSRKESMSSAKGSNQKEIEQSFLQLIMQAATAEQQQQQLRNQQWQQQ